jgi:hypothetical protein
VTALTVNARPADRYLILHAGALGDCVLTLHVAMALRKLGHRVTMAARSPIAVWAAKRALIDETFPLDRLSPLLWGTNSHSEGPKPHHFLLVENFDRIISFLGGPDEDVSKNLIQRFGANRVIHIDPRPTEKTIRESTHITQQWVEEINRQGFDFKCEISNTKYEISNWKSVVDGQDMPANMAPSPDRDSGMLPPRHATTSPHVIIHPGSGSRAKCCPLEHLEALMTGLLSHRLKAQWMIGPDEVERDGPDLRQRLERTAAIIFEQSVEAAADRVAAAGVFIGNDAGMTHVAGLAGVNTVALFGPTDPRVWRPLGPNCTIFPFPSAKESKSNWDVMEVLISSSRRTCPGPV